MTKVTQMGLASKACERGLQSRATVSFASVLRQRVTGRAELYQVARDLLTSTLRNCSVKVFLGADHRTC